MKEMIDLPRPKTKKRCEMCRATLPWHFLECQNVPGGMELYVANLEAEEQRLKEKTVSRDQAARIMRAIMLILSAPNKTIMIQRKEAIQDEIKQLKEQGK